MQRDRGHVLAVDDLVRRRRIQEVRHRVVCVLNDLFSELRRPERPAKVRAGFDQTLGHAIGHALRNLRAGGIIEIDAGLAVVDAMQ